MCILYFANLSLFRKNPGYDEGYLAGLAASHASKPSSDTDSSKKVVWDKLWDKLSKGQILLWIVIGMLLINQVSMWYSIESDWRVDDFHQRHYHSLYSNLYHFSLLDFDLVFLAEQTK